jgi:hypothetical protein
MATAADKKILLNNRNREKQRSVFYCCSVCGKKLKFSSQGRSEYSLSCWQCMVVNADS